MFPLFVSNRQIGVAVPNRLGLKQRGVQGATTKESLYVLCFSKERRGDGKRTSHSFGPTDGGLTIVSNL